MQPIIFDEVSKTRQLVENRLQNMARGFHKEAEPKGGMNPAGAIVQRLEGKADAKVAPIAFKDAQVATDHIVQNFVPAAVPGIVDGGCVILKIDPMGDDHRACEEAFEHRTVRVVPKRVIVEEGSALEVQVLGSMARREDHVRMVGEPPFGADLGPMKASIEEAQA
jgi:hypothetical protein